MYRVLVIEDEPPILRGICLAIEKCSNIFKVEDTAFNGEEAINLLKVKHYDLIITDINMPVNDGFSVLQFLMDENIDSIRIILSGYEEFSYARKALSYNIKDYLVKPIDKKKLEILLDEVAVEIENKKSTYKQNIFTNLLQHNYQVQINRKLDRPHIMVLLCAGAIPHSTNDFMSPGFIYWNSLNLKSYIKSIDGIDGFWLVNGNSVSEKVLVLDIDVTQKESIVKNIFNAINISETSITMAVSKPITSFDEVHHTHINLRKIIERKSLFSISSILYQESGISKHNNEAIDLSQFKLSLNIKEENNIKSALESILVEMNSKKLTVAQVNNTLNYIVIKLHECYTYKQNEVYTITLVEEILMNALNYNDLKNTLFQLVEKLQNASSYYDSKQELANNIKNYINENLNQPLTNQVLSQQFFLVPSYLSSIFKSHFGISAAEYIINIRIDKAKKLLEELPNTLTKDIAKAVGYNDPLYFSKVFKKKTGVTPSNYQKSKV